ncbi:hypothetical protein IW262DRAFT_1302031 [Armillaria fumosa]|nr:hypothetical protein IW262DRAFT_1302031 [Armillaria fumosa]
MPELIYLVIALMDLRSNGINALPLTNPDRYIFPTWLPAKEADKGMVNCHVKFSGITDPKMILHLRSWVAEFEKDRISVLYLVVERTRMQRFCNMCASWALELGVQVSVARHRSPIQQGLIMALALGACRTVTVNLASEKDLTNSNDYLHFFKRIGVITPESNNTGTTPSIWDCVLYENLTSHSQLAKIDRDPGLQSQERSGFMEQYLTTNALDFLDNHIPVGNMTGIQDDIQTMA